MIYMGPNKIRNIGKQVYGSIVHTNPTAIVHTIEPAPEAIPAYVT